MNMQILYSIITIAIISILLLYFYRKSTPQARRIINALVVEAERLFGEKMGTIKYTYVVGLIYPKLPFIIRTFISAKQLNSYIESGVYLLQAQLNKQKLKTIPLEVVVTPCITDKQKIQE